MVCPATSQTIDKTMRNPGNSTASHAKAGQENSANAIRLAPANKYNTAPADVRHRLENTRIYRPWASRAPKKKSMERIPALANVADSIILYGLHNADGTWQTLSPLASKVYSFHAAPVVSYQEETGTEIPRPMAAFYAKGKFYLLNSAMDENGLTNSSITTFDAATWQNLGTVSLAEGEPTMDMYFRQVAAYDPVTDKAYTISWGDGKPLLAIDLNTMEVSNMGKVNQFIQTLFVDRAGQLYGISFPDKTLHRIDKATGAATAVGVLDVPFNITADPMSAVCDPATGRVYWVAVDGSSKESALYTVNLADAHCEKVVDLPGDEHFLGLYIPDVNPDAPSAPKNISYAAGRLSFTAPSQTYTSGAALGGGLTALVSVDGGEAVETAVQPGQDVSVDLALADGSHKVSIVIANEAGRSPERRLNTFVGQDVPASPTGVTLAINDGKTAVLTWVAPTASMNGGPVDDQSIAYRVTRYPDEVVVAEGLKATSYSESVPEAHARYSYSVTATANGKDGGTATSNTVTAGSTWIPPYTETFETQADFDSFKVIDANNDGNTWTYMNPLGENGQAYLVGNGTADVDTGIYDGDGNDDYLISPQIRLEPNTDYRLTFETYDQWMTTEHMTVMLGGSQEVTGSETEIASLDLHTGQSYTVIFSVPASGLYHLFFHGDSPAQSVNVCLDNISLDVYSTFEGPDSVTGLKATAGEKGAIVNTVEFTAPVKTYKGGNLSDITRIEIYRNGSGKAAHVFEAPEPGQALSWTDTEVSQGSVTYRVVPFNAAGQGKEALVTNWVGLDMPADVSGLKAVMDADNHAVLTFERVGSVGKHGGYVNPDDVQYMLYRYNELNFMQHWEPVSDYTHDLTITDATFAPLWGERQQYVDYLVVAVNGAGSSDGAGAGIVLGDPYERPYSESFANGLVTNNPWTLAASSYNYAWNAVTGSGIAVKPYDGDEGMLQFAYTDAESNTQVIMGPRVSLAASESPELSFYMYHGYEAEPEDLSLIVYANYDDEGWDEAATVSYNNGLYGWSRYSIPLRANADNVQIAFGANAVDASASVFVDAISIDESCENDVAIESIAIDRKRVEAGESAKVTVNVANYGVNEAGGYSVVLLRDGAEVDAKAGAVLPVNGVAGVEFDVATTKADAAMSYSFSAVVDYDADVRESNDSSSTVRLYVHGSNLPVAENLTGTTSEGTVTLQWSEPSSREIPDAVTEDFDSYESFIIDGIGDWATYDGDGTPTVYFGGPQIAHAYEAKAWQVWAPVEAGFSLESFDVLTPHSGDKYLACWAASDGVSTTLPNDDWLISSDVVGGTDVSFYYRMPNEGSDPQVFEMMYSATDREPESFVAFDRDSIVAGTDWVRFEYTLPADAKYFAIRSCSRGSYTVAFLDDLTYTPLYGTTTDVTLLGYNVYRDNELIASGVTGCTFTDAGAGSGNHVYNVTAVWAEGESDYSNGYVSSPGSAIGQAVDAPAVRVASAGGSVVVTGASGKAVGIYALDGRKLFGCTGSDVTTVATGSGTFIVKVDGEAYKLVVR